MAIPRITANDLRFAAEGADSIRDRPAVLIKKADGRLDVVPDDMVPKDAEPLLDIETNPRGPGIVGDAKARVLWRGRLYGANIEHFDKADALFTTQSAIEKFLLPYYMRFKSAHEVGHLERVLFNDRDVIAAFHIPGSITFPIKRVGLIKATEGTDDARVELHE